MATPYSRAPRLSEKHAKAIAAALKDQTALDVAVVVLSKKALADVIKDNPFEVGGELHSKYLIAVSEHHVGVKSLSELSLLLGEAEFFEIGKHAAYLLCSLGIKESKAASALLGGRGKSVATRNWATVLKLNGLLSNETA